MPLLGVDASRAADIDKAPADIVRMSINNNEQSSKHESPWAHQGDFLFRGVFFVALL